MDERINIGCMVKSKCGRDKGNIYFIFKILDKKYVFLVDGDRRKIENPKKKKTKHLMVYKKKNSDIIKRLEENKIDDLFIKKSLASILNKIETNEQEDQFPDV